MAAVEEDMQPLSIERYWGVFLFPKEVQMDITATSKKKICPALRDAWDSYHRHNDMIAGRLDADTMADLVYRVHDIWPRNPHLSLDRVCVDAVIWLHRMAGWMDDYDYTSP